MKTKLTIVAVLIVVGVIIAGQQGSVVTVEKELVEIEKTVEVKINVLDKRIEEAVASSSDTIEKKAKEAYERIKAEETKKIEDKVKADYIREIEATISSPDY